MAEVREIVDLYNIQKEMDGMSETKMKEIPIGDADSWKLSLKKEIIYWGDYELTVNQATDNYIKENFTTLVNNASNNIENIYYIENTSLKDKKYIYNEALDIVYKVPQTKIGKHTVHSIEELDFIQKGGTREKGKNYTKIEYNVEFKQVGKSSYYEPDLNGLGKEVTSLIFYKFVDGKITEEEHPVVASEWINKGRPNVIQENGYTYALYDYENKIWANIRVISGSIETYWTWIPRYSFSNNTANTNPITNVKFMNIEDTLQENYELAGSFEGNDKKGIWVSKYQPSYKAQTDSTYFSYYIPDLSGFDKENTYIEVYNKDTGNFEKEVKASTIDNLTIFSQNNLWFDYDKKIWANIKVEKNGIETWWVWVPRYAFSNGENTTEAIFIDNVNNKPLDGKELPNTYTIAPAFEGNDKKGIWISKYQPSPQTVNLTENANSIPDLNGFDKENTYIEIYNKDTGKFEREVKVSTINDLETFAKENLWFDYKNKIWANIRVEKNGIETWWVWIPRYAYSNGGNTTDIVLITPDNKLLNGDEIPNVYTIAPVFEGNDKQGMWSSKYQPTSK